jgi:hypothetical protein
MALVLRDQAEKSSHLNCLILALAKMAGIPGAEMPHAAENGGYTAILGAGRAGIPE